MTQTSAITPELVQKLISGFSLDPFGVHGIAHWARVLENGRALAGFCGADRRVVELFAVFHDCKRCNDHGDAGHGPRAAEVAAGLRGSMFDLPGVLFDLLAYALRHHDLGLKDGHPCVLACWDADRLDLGRVGVTPDPLRLCTDAARDEGTLSWAHARSVRGVIPDLIRLEWGLSPTPTLAGRCVPSGRDLV